MAMALAAVVRCYIEYLDICNVVVRKWRSLLWI